MKRNLGFLLVIFGLLASPLMVVAQDDLPTLETITPENADELGGYSARLSGFGSGIYDIAFPPQAEYFLTIQESGVNVWELDSLLTPINLARLDVSTPLIVFNNNKPSTVIDYFPLVTRVPDNHILWDLNNPQEPLLLDDVPLLNNIGFIYFLSMSVDGSLITITARNQLVLWDTVTNVFTELRIPSSPAGEDVVDAELSPDGTLLAVKKYGDVGEVYLYMVEDIISAISSKQSFSITSGYQLPDEYELMAFTPNGQYFVTINREPKFQVWDTHTFEIIVESEVIEIKADLLGYTFYDIAFSPDNQLAAVAGCKRGEYGLGCPEHAVWLFDLSTGQNVHTQLYHFGRGETMFKVMATAFSPDGNLLLVGLDNEIEVLGIPTEG